MPHNSFAQNFDGQFFLIQSFDYDLTTPGKIHPALLRGGQFKIVMLPLRLLLKNYVF
jgi:hypothetical protein